MSIKIIHEIKTMIAFMLQEHVKKMRFHFKVLLSRYLIKVYTVPYESPQVND